EGRFRESLHSELESFSFQIAEANPVPLGKPLPSLLIFCFHILLLQVFARLSIKRKEEERKHPPLSSTPFKRGMKPR
ncbi:hypothetical protein, partial [Ornithobacterium rhinotracheale]